MSIEIVSSEKELPKPLIEFQADYGVHNGKFGVKVTVTSRVWENLFQAISGGKISHVKKNGVEGDLYDFPIQQDDRAFLDLLPNGNQLMQNTVEGTIVSLYYLRKPGISGGVDVFFPGIFESDTIRRYAAKVGERAEILYRKLTPGSVQMKLWLGDWKVGE